MEDKESQRILDNMKSLKKWMQSNLAQLDYFLKVKDDLQYYMQLAARLEKRVEALERKLQWIEEHDKNRKSELR